jgi:hypothetical protein
MGTQVVGNLSVGNRDFDADLRRPALRAKWAAILDRISAL